MHERGPAGGAAGSGVVVDVVAILFDDDNHMLACWEAAARR